MRRTLCVAEVEAHGVNLDENLSVLGGRHLSLAELDLVDAILARGPLLERGGAHCIDRW